MSRYAEMNSLTILQLSHYTELILPQCNLDVNDCLLIGPSLVCNCCVFFSFLLFGMQVSLYRQLYRPFHARLLLEF